MADEAEMESAEDTTVPSMDGAPHGADNDAVDKLHEEIDNLNLVLDHLERKNGDIYTRIEELLVSFKQSKGE